MCECERERMRQLNSEKLRFSVAILAFIYCSVTSDKVVASCYPAIFAFGTSLSDTGNAIRTSPLFLTSVLPPYGETYFGRPASRYSDGRLIIDFLADSLGLPFTIPYRKNKDPGTDFSRGINYAVAGATVQGYGYLILKGNIGFLTTDSLGVQLNWHSKMKSAADNASSSPWPGITLPSPSSFSEALYYIEFGGNDYGTAFLSKRVLQRTRPITNIQVIGRDVPLVVRKILDAVETLYANDARKFIIFNIPPEGCAPVYLNLLNGTKDALGCLEFLNEVDRVHNQQLYAGIQALQIKYPNLSITYVDINGLYNKILRDPSQFGFKETIQTCCGAGPGARNQFSLLRICSIISYVCPDPKSHVIWDGIHNTDEFNRVVVSELVSGQFVQPADALACGKTIAS